MLKKKSAIFTTLLLLATISTPATAAGTASQDLACTSSTYYSALIQSKATGSVSHLVDRKSDGQEVFRKVWSNGTTAQVRFNNTGSGGNVKAWVIAINTSTVTNAKIDRSQFGCGTSSTPKWNW